ncbi:LOW QUALITY PROTEIN: peroxisomal carnitine O-octanoyltransferase [Callorhinchus milii]|uniref:LOW QUALITY PROTEIN: peroxisomal carnitine O-octanoyltransferase n=1 Tax=Callorhinchus milii TaxID=7868 RepID=UPI0004574E40|nr:LOW QUALITY PROTEIN: peroxisomal carnitine O-octanoyltransferase [Callorhinchus milii]|eukprot:gi/632960693/ref/XP_007896339.1/ PREDICTED: peroxisomal carnitine O-octanoyltransferase [Callorhinchus milii]
MDGQMFESNEERTFQYQDSLPPLPVPNLCQSITKYLDSVKPFLTHEELQTTTQIAKRFLSGQGAELHAKLHSWAKDKRNWLEEWWLNSAYLDNREPTMLNVNFAGAAPYLEHYWEPKEGTQVERAALVVYYTVVFWQLIRKQQLAVHKSGAAPFDMDQFRMLYCTCRIPGETRDSIVNYFQTEEEGPCPSHLIVQCRGRVFVFNTLVNEQILTPPEIFRQLTFIRELCGKEPEGPGVSALTSEARTKWAKAREYLISLDPTNVTVLELIQNSLFVLSLDDTSPNVSPEDYSEICAASLTGNPTVRWGDKSYNCLSFANGTFGSNCDHSPYDAMVMVSLCYYIDLQVKSIEGKWQGSKAIRDIPLPEELIFVVDEKILEDIEQAKQQYQKQVSDIQIISYAFTAFGKSLIKKRLHPDIFVQLGLQLAYYRLHGRPGVCYETATTRRFYHGRTETMRPCTMEAVEWCKGMLDPDVPPEKRLELFMKAVGKHHELMTEAQVGKGFDRHLLGLLQIAKEEGLPVPELYTDIGFTRSGGGGNFVLSTSLVGYTTVLGAVVPMVRNGYGFFYRIRDDRIVVACSAWKSSPETNAEELYKAVSLSFQEMVQMVSKSQL